MQGSVPVGLRRAGGTWPRRGDVAIRRLAAPGRVRVAEERLVLAHARERQQRPVGVLEQLASVEARRRRRDDGDGRTSRSIGPPPRTVAVGGCPPPRRRCTARPPIVPLTSSGAAACSVTVRGREVSSAPTGPGARPETTSARSRRRAASSGAASASAASAVPFAPVWSTSVTLAACCSIRSGSSGSTSRRNTARAASVRVPGLKPSQRIAAPRTPGEDCEPGARRRTRAVRRS